MRIANTLLGMFCGVTALFWGGAWLNNVYLSWIKRIWRMEGDVASTTKGVLPALDLFSIDHSTVSTFIPFFGFAWMALVFYDIRRSANAEKQIDLKKEFPYFSGYSEWMVSLGLMGTVWGLIMIGFFPDLENLKITGLIEALRTALFSTLVALFWVYIVVLRIFRPGMRLWAAKYLGQSETSVSASSLQMALATFVKNLEGLNAALSDSTQRIEDFRETITVKKLADAEAFFAAATENLPAIKESCQQTVGALEKVRLVLDEQLAVSHRHSGSLDELSASQSEQQRKLAAIHDALIRKEARDANGRKRLGKAIEAIKGYCEE